jgi:hypothetical protein
MKIMMMGVAALGLMTLTPVAAQAEPNDRPPPSTPLLHIVTYDTGYGTASVSYFFGQPITDGIRFHTIGERDTRKEGFGPRGRNK